MEKREIYRETGLRLRVARERRGATQKELADVLDIDPATVSSYESGRRAIPLEAVIGAAAFLGCSVAFLAGEEKTPELEPVLAFYRQSRDSSFPVPEASANRVLVPA